jgi:hypothetical protein
VEGCGPPYLDVRALILSPVFDSDHVIFAGTTQGVFKSTDGGALWSWTNSGLTELDVFAVAISPAYASDATIFAGTFGEGVFKSRDGGDDWTPVNAGLTDSNGNVLNGDSLAISPGYAGDQTLFAATVYGVFKSTNGGASWSYTGPDHLIVNSVAISPGFADDHTLFAGVQNSGVYKSTNGGGSWTFNGLASSDPETIALSPAYASDQTLFVGTDDDGAFRSRNGGASWDYIGIPEDVFALAISPQFSVDHTIYAGRAFGVYQSHNAGDSWSPMITGLGVWITALALAPTDPRILFAGPTFHYGIWKYSVGGPTRWLFLPSVTK